MRLFGIVAVLLIPIMLLSYLLIAKQFAEIDFTKRELRGAGHARDLMAGLIGLSSGELSAKDIEAIVAKVQSDTKELGSGQGYTELREILRSEKAASTDQVRALARLIHSVGEESNLILDPYKETFFLALAATFKQPVIVAEYRDFESYLQGAIASAGIDDQELKVLHTKMGRIAAVIGDSRDTVLRVKGGSSMPGEYAELEKLVSKLGNAINVMTDVSSSAKRGSEGVVLSMIARQNFNSAEFHGAARKVSLQTFGKLEQLLRERFNKLELEMYGLYALALVSLIFGAGASNKMFHSTLRRLDLVEEEKKRADEALEEAERARTETEQINSEVAKLNRELSSNIQRLKEAQDEIVKKGRMEQMGQLTATIAHELRNPLGAVRTSAFLIDRKIKGLNLGLEIQMQRINNGIQRCDNIITQLLDYSRNKPLQCKPDNLDEWLSRIVSEEAARLPQSIMIELVLGLDERPVPFDGSRLQRAIINLMSNAAEALINSDKSDSRSPADHKIWVSTHMVSADTVAIRVRDNGPGIAPEHLARVREPLFTTKSFGTGLGIPAIEQIARQHGGKLEIESRVGDGACFEIHLPLRPESEVSSAA